MARRITFAQAAAIMERFERESEREVLAGFTSGLRAAHRLAVTKYMVGGGKNAPANPPPGPLRIRSGKLRRTVRVDGPRKEGGRYVGGIFAGSSTVPYARIHELGGTIPARIVRPRKAQFLSWVGKDGVRVFARQVSIPAVTIRPRPYLTPAMTEGRDLIAADVQRRLQALARRLVG